MHLLKSQISVVCLLAVVALSLSQGHGMPAGSPHGTATHLSARQIPGVPQPLQIISDYTNKLVAVEDDGDIHAMSANDDGNVDFEVTFSHAFVPQPIQLLTIKNVATGKYLAIDGGTLKAVDSPTTQFEVEYRYAGGAFELLKAHGSDATCYVAFQEPDGRPVDDACSITPTDQRALLGLDFQ